MRLLRIGLALWLLTCVGVAQAALTFPALSGRVVDTAQMIDPATREHLTQQLQAIAFFLEVGAAEFDRTFEFALELQVEFAAFGHEVASDVITFGGFSGHGLWGILAARRTAASIIAAP